jgi:uncharacterized protein YjbI with pentapeptide repeats
MHQVGMQETSAMSCDFEATDLSNSVLPCDLSGSIFEHTDVTDAHLEYADLRDSLMSWMYLHGTNLKNANLKRARFSGTNIDETTTLPDGTTWTPDIEMRRFGCIVDES